MAKPFIAAYHAGATSVNSFITSDQLIYWYRPTLAGLDCDATDTTMVSANNASGNYFEGRPNGWQDMQDAVFVVSMLTAPGVVTITSGGNTQSFNAPAGATAFQIPMAVGQQQFSLTRNGATVLSGVSLKNISPICICGIYNFNAYVGTLPPGFSDPLGHDGLASLTAGLHVNTCSATPSLGTAPAAPTTTVTPTTTYYIGTTHNNNKHYFNEADHHNIHNHHKIHIHLNYQFCTSVWQHSLCCRHWPWKLCRTVQLLLQLWILPSRPVHLHSLW
jgi:hypothetical protein